jgi:hypothetical protein
VNLGPSDVATQAIEQLDALLKEIEPGIEIAQAGGSDWYRASDQKAREMRTRATSAIQRLAPANSAHAAQAYELNESSAHDGWIVTGLAGVMRALLSDIESGYMQTVEELVHADVFADFIEMAEELVGKNYKDAAAVITGSVLEEHLRKLAGKHGIATAQGAPPVKAATLNDELARRDAYNKLTQKSVTAWLDLRNKAAHGHYDEYDRGQVEALIRDVRSFMERLPA